MAETQSAQGHKGEKQGSVTYKTDRQEEGEMLNLKADDPDVVDALDFAMNEFNAMRNNLYRLISTKVEDATVQIVSGRKFCIVSVIGKSKSCRNDKAHRPVSLDLCPVDTPEVGDCVLGICGYHTTHNGGNALSR